MDKISVPKRNVVHMSLCFFLVFTAFSAIQNLETSVIKVPNVGAYSLAVLYIVFTISCLFGPVVALKLGESRSIFIAFLAFDLFFAANLISSIHPNDSVIAWATIMPSSAAIGLVGSILWTAEGTYISTCAVHEEKLCGATVSKLGFFNGIFWLLFQSTQLTGNLTASFVLGGDEGGEKLVVLFIVYLVCGICGTVLAFFLPKLARVSDMDSVVSDSSQAQRSSLLSAEEGGEGKGRGVGLKDSLLENDNLEEGGGDDDKKAVVVGTKGKTNPLLLTVELWKNRRMLQLVPLIMYSGIEMGFIWGDFTANYVKPALGASNIGYVMAAFGAIDAASSFLFGRLSDKIGRTAIMVVGGAAQLTVTIFFLVFTVSFEDQPSTWVILIFAAGLWGVGDAAWNTQLNSILGEEFADQKEGAFANLKLFQGLSTSLAFFYSGAITQVTTKLYIQLAWVIVGEIVFLLPLTDKKRAKRDSD